VSERETPGDEILWGAERGRRARCGGLDYIGWVGNGGAHCTPHIIGVLSARQQARVGVRRPSDHPRVQKDVVAIQIVRHALRRTGHPFQRDRVVRHAVDRQTGGRHHGDDSAGDPINHFAYRHHLVPRVGVVCVCVVVPPPVPAGVRVLGVELTLDGLRVQDDHVVGVGPLRKDET
jgi:hypothetical protein